MSYDPEPKDGPRLVDAADYDAADDEAETPFEAEQRRGRERMIGMWRSAVRTVTEAAQRAAAQNDAGGAEAEPETPDVDGAVATWVFPPSRAPAASRN